MSGLHSTVFALLLLSTGTHLSGCGEDEANPLPAAEAIDDPAQCLQPVDADPASVDFLPTIGCSSDFLLLSSAPMSAQISGARSVKTVIDRLQDHKVHWQNSKTFAIHWEFASATLSGNGLPPVPAAADFSTTEYYSPSRRFLLGAVTHYEEPDIWAYEIAPWDTASAEMIATSFGHLVATAWFGPKLVFHPTSQAVSAVAASLPPSVPVVSTQELFAGITYRPANLGTTTGKLRFINQEQFAAEDLGFRDIVVLDHVPNDIGVVAAIVTATHQTPLSHINVLSQNRGTPNMVLIGAFEHPGLLALDGKWVELNVGAFDWSISEITAADAEAWWEANKPPPLGVPQLNTTTTELRDIPDLLGLDPETSVDNPPARADMRAALDLAIPAYGGKASHYAGFAYMGADFPHPKAFAIPVHYYMQHLADSGLDKTVESLLADALFRTDATYRKAALETLRDDIVAAPIDPGFLDAVETKLNDEFTGLRMRFRSSTNAEDLEGFTGAGLYTSRSGDPNDPARPVADAIRNVWASIWNAKAYDEREFRSIEHTAVGMALLVHHSFPDEEANGVALTANIFDTSGLEPGFYINVQAGEESVVFPEPGITTDQFIYQYSRPGQPIIFITHSNLVAGGETVLSLEQTFELGGALDRIHRFWAPTYGPPVDQPGRFFAMDVEFKFDGEAGEVPKLFVKQARPHPGWGAEP
ncbi:MAG: pyruvate,water dikinase [Myxococcota bacterium]|jgi:pyruvate,water dikinase